MPDEASMQALEEEATGTVDRKHPQIGLPDEAPVPEAQGAGQGGEDDLHTQPEHPVREEATHSRGCRRSRRAGIRERPEFRVSSVERRRGVSRVRVRPVTTLKYGQPAPEFALPATGDRSISLAEFRGRANVVLVFYCYDFGRI
jgi:hypothetical protein